MRNFAPASPTPFPFPSAPSHLALTGRQSLCLILILSVSNHYSSLKAPQNLTANNHNEALKEGEGVEELEKLAQDAAQESHQPSMSLPLPQSLPPVESLLRCLLCRFSVVAGGWLPLPQPRLQSRNLSHLQCELLLLLLFVDCLISAVVFLCLVRARQSQQQFETSTKPFKLLFAFVALFDFARNAHRKRGCRGMEAEAL